MLDRLARDDVETLLAPVAPSDQRRLLGAMRTIEGVLWIAELDGERVGCVCVVADSEEVADSTRRPASGGCGKSPTRRSATAWWKRSGTWT